MAGGLLLCIAWYYTIICGFYILYCPVMYLMFLNHKWYRNIVDVLFALWELYPVGLFQWCCNTQLHHYGDFVNPDEKTIIVMNHRTRVDWNYVWIALYHATQNPFNDETCICKENYKSSNKNFLDFVSGGRSKIKFVLKDEIKTIPGLGWIMQLNFFLYVKRNWREDQIKLSQFVDYYKKLRYCYRVILFPEGTDMSESNRSRSNKFAGDNNLPVYDFVLHPRTTGWMALCSRLQEAGLDSVYDVTIAYDQPAQTELDLLCGKMPKQVYFFFKRYSCKDLPHDESGLKQWLIERWKDKESCLRRFHSDGEFYDATLNKPPTKRMPRSLFTAKLGFIFWTLIDITFLYALFYSSLFVFWVMYHTLLFVFVTWYFGGFHNIQYNLLTKAK